MNISYLSAPAGSGKTHGLRAVSKERVLADSNIILLQPTKRLLNETFSQFGSEFTKLHVEMIHEDHSTLIDTAPSSVTGEIIRYLKNPYPEPHVFMITWEAFQRLEFISNKSNWDIIVDEIPQSFDVFDGFFQESHSHLTDHLELMPYGDSKYSLLWPKNRNEIRRIAENKSKDETWELFRKIAIRVESPHWNNYVLSDSYNNLINNKNGAKKLTIFSFMSPSIFQDYKSVLISGACFEESILYKSFLARGVTFREDTKAKQTLRYHEHQNGSLVTICYALDVPWSKRLRDKDDRKIWDKMIEAVKSIFADKEFVWAANKDIGDDLFGWDKAHMRLPQSPHGLNSFSNVHNVAYLSVQNLSPASAKFIQDQLHMTREEIDTAIHRQTAYQNIMRISTRNPDDPNEKAIFVPDFPTAEYFQNQLAGAQLATIDIGMDISHGKRGRKKIHESNIDKDRKYQDQLRQNVQNHIQNLFLTNNDPSNEINLNDENTYINSNKVVDIWTSVFRNKTDKIAEQVIAFSGYREIEVTLEKCAKNKFDSKEQNRLICPSVFDPDKSNRTSKGLENIVTCNSIWLDFDGGDLKPEDLAGLFPNIRMTIYSTYGSKKSELRYRVFIPLSSHITVETYKAFTGHIRNELERNGYFVGSKDEPTNMKRSGLDTSKLHPASLFYLPCQPEDKSGKYFNVFRNKGRDALQVDNWLELVKAPDEVEYSSKIIPASAVSSNNEAKIKQAKVQWHESTHVAGTGHDEFYKLGLRLAAYGCDAGEMRCHLYEQSGFARSPDERKKEIEHVIINARRFVGNTSIRNA